MRIDGTYNVEPRRLGDAQASARRDGQVVQPAAKVPIGAATPARAPLIAQAAAVEEVNSQAVVEARRLLASGELDTLEAAARAAKAIVDLGL